MADQITKIEFYMGAVANKVGEGASVLSAVRDAGINLIGFLGYPKNKRSAEIVLVVAEGTRSLSAIAKKAGFELGSKQKGFFVQAQDRPGAVAEIAAKLAGAGINIVSVHALCSGEGRFGALIALASTDLRKASKALGV
jgi:hypothetical protein